MADDRSTRISRLGQRFTPSSTPSKTTSTRTRERQSLYLDAELMKQVDQTHREVAHRLYPQRVNKSTFLETLLKYGLDHLDDVASQLPEKEEGRSGS